MTWLYPKVSVGIGAPGEVKRSAKAWVTQDGCTCLPSFPAPSFHLLCVLGVRYLGRDNDPPLLQSAASNHCVAHSSYLPPSFISAAMGKTPLLPALVRLIACYSRFVFPYVAALGSLVPPSLRIRFTRGRNSLSKFVMSLEPSDLQIPLLFLPTFTSCSFPMYNEGPDCCRSQDIPHFVGSNLRG